MFGWSKAKLIKELQDTIQLYKKDVEDREQTIREMADEIRNMDQLIFRMSQCTDWPSMRPIFNELQARQERRQRKESDRITNILRRELISVYEEPRK